MGPLRAATGLSVLLLAAGTGLRDGTAWDGTARHGVGGSALPCASAVPRAVPERRPPGTSRPVPR